MTTIRSYHDAQAYLAKARARDRYRPVKGARNSYLERRDAHSIALVFHSTDIVTYHDDGTQDLYTGGWWTMTTKARIKEFSAWAGWFPNHNGTKGGGAEGWVIGSVGTTEPKVQKCRARGSKYSTARGCRGTGRVIEYVTCHGPATDYDERYRDRNRCKGPTKCDGRRYDWPRRDDGTTDYKAPMQWFPCPHGREDAHELEPCPHGRDGAHVITPCEHGYESSHRTGTREVECWQCHGAGTQDYGSKAIPLVWSSGRITITDAGELVNAPGADSVIPTPKPKSAGGKNVHTGPDHSAHAMGSEVADRLGELLPGMSTSVKCPRCAQSGRVRDVIVHLNDSHHETREVIADWLETLDVDLTFPAIA